MTTGPKIEPGPCNTEYYNNTMHRLPLTKQYYAQITINYIQITANDTKYM